MQKLSLILTLLAAAALEGCPHPSETNRCSTEEFSCSDPVGSTDEPGRVCIVMSVGGGQQMIPAFNAGLSAADGCTLGDPLSGEGEDENPDALSCGCYDCRSFCEEDIETARALLIENGIEPGTPFCTNPTEC